MDPEQIPDLLALERDAQERAAAGEWQLRLSVLPAFGDIVVLGVQRSRGRHDHGTVLLRRWRRALDFEKLHSPVERLRHPRLLTPTIDELDQSLSKSQSEEFSRRIYRDFAIPVLCPSGGVTHTDGVRYEVHRSQGTSSCTLSWFLNFPADWRPLMTWFSDTWRWLASLFNVQDVAAQQFYWETKGINS
jgi:hypothetical protein